MITRKIIAGISLAYLQHHLSLEESVNWTEITLLKVHIRMTISIP